MQLKKYNLSELEAFCNDQELLNLLIMQINKDFDANVCQTQTLSLHDNVYQNILTQVHQYLVELSARQPEKLMNIIYKVDIPDHYFQKIFKTSTDVTLDLAKVIIQRELLKVMIRKNYKT